MDFTNFFLICWTVAAQFQIIASDISDGPCPEIRIPFGKVKLRSKGRVARFKCDPPYQVYGNKSATCIRGTWDATPPICIRNNCPRLPKNPMNGNWYDQHRGATFTLLCDSGYKLVGARTIYCYQRKWSADIPTCEGNKTSQTSCDFEKEDLCGWTNDVYRNFNWSRLNFATPSGHVGTGPSFDHTLGKGYDGHYMYIESSSPRLMNDTARLLSPIYEARLAQNSCFIFWYHMYGATTGSLNVYIKELSSDINNMTAIFYKNGQQGNKWLMGLSQLPPVNESFQIIIEAIRGPSYASDIAIDDLKLANGDECQNATIEAAKHTTPQKPKSSNQEFPLQGTAGLIGGLALAAAIAAIAVYIYVRRRMLFKKRNDMSEDSDVRYLTSDEVLDFNLAKPMDDDL